MSSIVRELVEAAEAFDSACDSADPREFDAARARLRRVLPKITTEDDPDATPPSEAPSGGLDPERIRQLAQALSCWSSIGEGDPEFMPWAEQMIRAYLAPTPGQGDSGE